MLKRLQSHLYRIPRMEMKRKEASNESSLCVGWCVAARSEGKQKSRENETNKKIPNVTNFLLFLHRIPKIWKADFFPVFIWVFGPRV